MNLIKAITDPSVFVGEDLITLHTNNVEDCGAGIQFGMDMLNELRKARKVIGTVRVGSSYLTITKLL